LEAISHEFQQVSMTPVISPAYAVLNRQLHADRPDYGTGGGERAPMVVQLAGGNGWKTILDYGCSEGLLLRHLHAARRYYITLGTS